ncbi:thymidylate kinase [Pseudomonas putida]|uniref:Thymidylate kinase n=1 Tax=Pseudomonas putida TaxID=303 RepID=A0A4D6XCV8_PSEPU|nr:dTMP kinase [Pseudomonas putida]QCI12460.1 thymidylate kinase [Pseudomonas putida]
MKSPLFISLDGPKGTGKTTLAEAVTQALRADGHKVVRLSEKMNDPHRAETMGLVNALARNPSVALELSICERLAQSRAWISQHVLPKQPAGSIILIDRWYPSDAAFRRLIPFAEALRLNMEQHVRVPDLHVGVVTDPQISWDRAAARTRGLGSTVIQAFHEHVAATQAFEQAFIDHGWLLCRNEGTIELATRQVAAAIGEVIRGADQVVGRRGYL